MVIVTISSHADVRFRSAALLKLVEELRHVATTDTRNRILKEVFGPFAQGGIDWVTMEDLSHSDFEDLRAMLRERFDGVQEDCSSAKQSDPFDREASDRFRALIDLMNSDPRSIRRI